MRNSASSSSLLRDGSVCVCHVLRVHGVMSNILVCPNVTLSNLTVSVGAIAPGNDDAAVDDGVSRIGFLTSTLVGYSPRSQPHT